MNNQIKLIAFLLFLPIFLLGQNKFSGGVNISTELSSIKTPVMIDDASEKGKIDIGYSVGAHISYLLSNNLYVRSGLNYEQSNYRYKINELRFGTDIINGTESSLENKLSITSIGIPLEFIYKIPLKSINSKFILGFGGILNMNLNNSSSSKIIFGNGDQQPVEGVKNDIESSLFSLLVNTGIEIGLKNNRRLSIEPQFKYTPNEFTLYLYELKVSSVFEIGITARLSLF